MIISKTCSCGYKGELYLPEKEAVKNTILTCPRCSKKEDISYFYNTATLNELERKEYERLSKKYG